MKQRRSSPSVSRAPENPSVLDPEMGGPGAMGNAAMQEQLLARGDNAADQGPRFAGKEQLLADLEGETLVANNVDDFMKTNLYKAMVRLVEKERWDEEFAASWLGQAVVETGKANLEKLDVVEAGSGAGRGMFQYTGARRTPYDRARAQALRNGRDPNDIDWQIDYALDKDNPAMNLDAMREGLTRPDKNYSFHPKWGVATGRTPTGKAYGNRFKDANSLMSSYGNDRTGGYTRALTGEYTRPGIHHMDRRLSATRRILRNYREAVKKRSQGAVA